MAKKARPAPAQNLAESDRLAMAIERLADAVIVLRDTVDAIREDISWVSRNGLPVQPIEHVVVKRMARDPCAAKWSDHLQIERSTFPAEQSGSLLNADACDRIADELKTTFEAVAQGQLEVVLTALVGVRAEILNAVNRRRPGVSIDDVLPTAADSTPPVPTVEVPKHSPGRGLLF